MLIKTRGIVIRNVKYSESSVISKIYTRQLGMQSYIINGIHSPKAAIKPSILQPLILLDLVVYHSKLKNVHRIKEARGAPALNHLHYEVSKSATGLFMSELINKSVKEEEPNEMLFDFLEGAIIYLDASPYPEPLFPLYFLVRLSGHLGFLPQNNWSEDCRIFNLREGYFETFPELGENAIDPPESDYLSQLLDARLEDIHQLQMPKIVRNNLLQRMLQYYALHIPNFQALKSLPVLMNIMRVD